MKKFVVIVSVCLLIIINIFTNTTFADNKAFKEGVYPVAKLEMTSNNSYVVKNDSKTEKMRIIIFNNNNLTMQNVILEPLTLEKSLVPIQDNYKVVIIGDGEVEFIQK